LLKAENLERQWANQSLEHQLRYSQIIINSINDLIFVTTKALNITRVNPAVAHLTGLEPKELISGPLSRVVRLVVDGPASDDGDPIARALKDGRDLRDWPAVVVTKYNQSIPCLFNMVPLRDNNKVVGGVVTVRKAQAQP
jgi:PAS domain S-box-containing protein